MALHKALTNTLYSNYLRYKGFFKFIKNHSNDILQEHKDSHTEIFTKTSNYIYLGNRHRTYGC
jgi:hypothetical protein